DSLEGTFRFDLERLATPEQSLDSLEVTATLVREPDNYRDLQINSSLADISVRGNYRFTTLIEAVTRQVDILTRAIEKRYQNVAGIDSTIAAPPPPRDTVTSVAEEDLNVDFSVRVRDLSPLTLVSP